MSVRMKSMYARAIHEFIEKVNKLNNVKLSWANAYDGKQNNIQYVDDESKFNKATAKGADKLLLAFTSSVGQGTRTVYGFRNDPNLGDSNSNLTSLSYSSKSSKGRDINGIVATYNKSIASRDEMLMLENMPEHVFEDLSRYTSRVFNSVPTYAVLFDGYSYADYDETIENIKAMTTMPEYVEHVEAIRNNMSSTINDGVMPVDEGEELQAEHYLTCDNLTKYVFMDMLAAAYEDEDDIPREYVDKTLGLDRLYDILSEINDDLYKYDTTIDLASRLSGNDKPGKDVLSQDCSNVILALNTVALYGAIRRKNNLLSKDDTVKVQNYPQIVISDDFYNTLKYTNSNRIGRFGAKEAVFDEITETIGTPIHAYDKCYNTKDVNYDTYVAGRSLNMVSKYRIYQAMVNPETKNRASNIPYVTFMFDDESEEYVIDYKNETYTLRDFADGNGECDVLRKALPCLATCSYEALVKNVDDVYKKFVKSHPDEIDCDILAVEMGVFNNMISKDSDMSRVLQNNFDDFDTKYRNFVMQKDELFSPVIHNTNMPSYDNGTYEIGTFIQNVLDKKAMTELSVDYYDDLLETYVINTRERKGTHVKNAYNFRKTDLALRKLDLIKEQYGNYDMYGQLLENKCKLFGTAVEYIGVIDEYMSEGSNIGKSKVNDFMTLVDTYNVSSVKSIKHLVEDINRVYRDKPQTCPSNAAYRPKNANEASILRSMCSDFDILDKVPAAVSGRDRDFMDIVKSLATTIKRNEPEYDFSKSISTASQIARAYDTLDDTTYSEVVDILTQVNNRDDSETLQKTEEKSEPIIPMFNFSL